MAKKRKDGRLQKKLTIDGKAYFVYGRTQEELEIKAMQKRQELKDDKDRLDHPTLDQFFDNWMESHSKKVKDCTVIVEESLHKNYSNVYIQDCKKRLGDMRLEDITVSDVRHVQSVLAESMKTNTVNAHISALGFVFKNAIKEQLITFNPCSAVETLRRTEEKARDTIHRALTLEETAAFFEEAEKMNSYYLPFLLFLVNTGMRAGEGGAIFNTDIRDNLITVERTLTKAKVGNKSKVVIGEDGKTISSRRTIPLNDAIRKILNMQRELRHMLDGSDVLQMKYLIFTSPQGTLISVPGVDREIGKICKNAGVERFTSHAFRATFATRQIEAGVNPRTVQELLGHSDYKITMNLYGHVTDKTKHDAMDGFSVAL